MNKYEINVILQPNHKNYSGRRVLKMDCLALNREDAIERVKGYLEGMLQDYVTLIVD